MSNDACQPCWIVSLSVDADGDAVDRLKRHGFSGVELSMPCVTGSDFELTASKTTDCAARLRSDGIEVRTIALAHDAVRNIGSADTTVREAAIADVVGVLDLATRVGAGVVTITAGAVQSEDGSAIVNRYEDAYHYSLKSMMGLRFEAAWRCVRLAFRVCRAGFLVSPMDARGWFDDVNSAWVGARVDPSTIGAIGCPIDWLRTLGHRSIVADYSAAAGGDASAATSQPADWRPLIHFLRGLNNENMICLSADEATLSAATSLAGEIP